VLCAEATMGYKHKIVEPGPLLKSLATPSFMVKIIPHVDGTLRICELVKYFLEDVQLKGAWSAPAALELFHHVACDVARLPVREVLGATHFKADLTLGLGTVVHDYMKS
jgi:acetoacetate decarboxylase